MQSNDDPVFGPPLAGPRNDSYFHVPGGASPSAPVPTASALVNVTFRVALSGEAAAAPDAIIHSAVDSAMASAVRNEISRVYGATLDGSVQVTAQVTRS